MSNCIFCKIIAGEIPSPRVYEDDSFICIRDIQPQAKTHLLLIPKMHLASLADAFPESGTSHSDLMGKMMEVAVRVARENQLLPHGFRSVINTGEGGGQSVHHLHLHILAGSLLDRFA